MDFSKSILTVKRNIAKLKLMALKVTIAIETCFLFDQLQNRGIGRHGREIYKRLLVDGRLNGQEIKVLWLGFNDLAQNLECLFERNIPADLPEIEFVSLGKDKLSSPITNLRLYVGGIRPIVQKYSPDIYFAMYFERGLPVGLVPVVVTSYDAIPMRTKKFSSRSGIVGWLKGKFYKHMWYKQTQAAAIVTVSNTSKAELIDFGHLPAAKIKVVNCGISEIFFKNEAELGDWRHKLPASTLNADYLIYDGGLEANKNVDQLFRTFDTLLATLPSLKLVLTGNDFEPGVDIVSSKPKHSRAEMYRNLAIELGIESHIIPVGRVSEPALVGLLKHAKAYINFSDLEGFGFGPLQAMAAGVAPIISNNACFIEISGAASLVLDPENLSLNTEQILKLLTNQTVRNDLIAKGEQHIKQFNWDKSWSGNKLILEQVCASLL